MKVKILSKDDRKVKFLLEDSNPQFANALRRIMISEVPVLAIQTVDFTANDSVLYNEMIAQRLGLVPLVFNSKDFHFKDKHEEVYDEVVKTSKKIKSMSLCDACHQKAQQGIFDDDTVVIPDYGRWTW